jgi:hypothetical protein
MSVTAHSRTGGDTGTMGRLPMLVPPLAALLYPFSLEGFNTSVTHIVASGASTLSWLSAAACLTLAFATPLIAILAAMSFSEIGRPTVAQLDAKRTALKLIARAHCWFDDLISGRAASMVEIAKREKVGKRYVSRIIRLAFLAPEIAEQIVNGCQPPDLTAQSLLHDRTELPLAWDAQHRVLGFPYPA